MKAVALLSECPQCGEERLQHGHDPDELVRALLTGDAIEAYCMACNGRWEMSTAERADVARELNQ